MGNALKGLGILPLAERETRLGNVRQGLLPVAILGGAMTLTTLGVLLVSTAFFTAAVLTVLCGALSLREASEAIDWPILVMLGALIPVSESIRTTGGPTSSPDGSISSPAPYRPTVR